jgi:hypothetical protein
LLSPNTVGLPPSRASSQKIATTPASSAVLAGPTLPGRSVTVLVAAA